MYIFAIYICICYFSAMLQYTDKITREMFLDTLFHHKRNQYVFFIFPGVGNTDIDTSYHHGNIRPIKYSILKLFSPNINKKKFTNHLLTKLSSSF